MDVSTWLCCLHPAERNCLRLCAAEFLDSLSFGFPRAVYDAYWASVAGGGRARSDAFASIFRLRFGEVDPNPDELPLAWVFFDDPSFWTDVSLFALSEGGLCLDGCSLTSYLAPVS